MKLQVSVKTSKLFTYVHGLDTQKDNLVAPLDPTPPPKQLQVVLLGLAGEYHGSASGIYELQPQLESNHSFPFWIQTSSESYGNMQSMNHFTDDDEHSEECVNCIWFNAVLGRWCLDSSCRLGNNSANIAAPSNEEDWPQNITGTWSYGIPGTGSFFEAGEDVIIQEYFDDAQGMGIQYYCYFQYFQISIGYWYFQYF